MPNIVCLLLCLALSYSLKYSISTNKSFCIYIDIVNSEEAFLNYELIMNKYQPEYYVSMLIETPIGKRDVYNLTKLTGSQPYKFDKMGNYKMCLKLENPASTRLQESALIEIKKDYFSIEHKNRIGNIESDLEKLRLIQDYFERSKKYTNDISTLQERTFEIVRAYRDKEIEVANEITVLNIIEVAIIIAVGVWQIIAIRKAFHRKNLK